MRKKILLPLAVAALVVVTGVAMFLLRGTSIDVLAPKGTIAEQQFDLILLTSLLSLIIVIPVFALTFFIVWKYRAGNTKAKYDPQWDHSRKLEAAWWLIPFTLIAVLAVITWVSSHKLDPYRPIESDKKPVTIQVIALPWKWLFIYPEQDIATVNYVQFPEKTPVNFELTADAPMNSFWIPQLGGQVYAMAGMTTKLHLEASGVGEYRGSSANISGEGFAGMKFTARSTSQKDFDAWVLGTKTSSLALTLSEYEKLAKPSENNPPTFYSSRDANLYDTVIMKYMMPGTPTPRPVQHSHEGHY